MISPVVVFDVGGTLIQPDFIALREWTISKTMADVSTSEVGRAFRLAIAGDVFADLRNEIEIQAARFFSCCGCSSDLDLHWSKWWAEIMNCGGAGSWLYKTRDPDAVPTLLHLRELGCHLIAASNSDGTLLEELRSFDLLDHFDEVYDSTTIGAEKPSLAFYEHVLRSSASRAVVHVGDDLIKDVIAAAAADFDRAVLYDPEDIYVGIPSFVRIRRLSEVPAAIGIM